MLRHYLGERSTAIATVCRQLMETTASSSSSFPRLVLLARNSINYTTTTTTFAVIKRAEAEAKLVIFRRLVLLFSRLRIDVVVKYFFNTNHSVDETFSDFSDDASSATEKGIRQGGKKRFSEQVEGVSRPA